MESFSSSKIDSWLPWFLRGLLLLGLIILLGRVFELQLIKGYYFRQLAEGNRVRRVPIVASRGKIFARGGETLVGNKEIKRAVVFDPQEGFEKLEVEGDQVDADILTEWARDYVLREGFAHVSGYLGEVDKEEVGKVNPECLEKGPRKLGSLIGRTGLEEQYECKLAGIDGEELVEVDSLGQKVRTLGRLEPKPGEDIKTTIHYGLQNKVAQVMKGEKGLPAGRQGAVVVSDTKGEVLALYSSPSYDPNVFVERDSDKIMSILKNKNNPLFNRVISGVFHPGSVYKPVVVTAGLEEGSIDEYFKYDDPGVITIDSPYGSFSYSNWYFTQYGRKEGEIGVVRAITRSTDTFFYKLGEFIGVDSLNDWSQRFGLDELTGIDLPAEVAGLVPSPEWKERVKGERWFLGNTYHMSIGQGDIVLTPIAMNSAISTIASGGFLCRPRLVDTEESENSQCKDLGISPNTLNLVKEGMQGACLPGGTGFTFFDFPEKTGETVACKTGTAETGDGETTHAWFVAFAPVDFPEIVVTVLVEKGGEGAYVAGPIAREIFDYWFVERGYD